MSIRAGVVSAIRKSMPFAQGGAFGAAGGAAFGAPLTGAAIGAAGGAGIAFAGPATKLSAAALTKAGGTLGATAAGAGLMAYPFMPTGEFADPEDYVLSTAVQANVLLGPVGAGVAAAGGIAGGALGAIAGRGRGFKKMGRFAAIGAAVGAAAGFIGTGRYVAGEFARETPTRFRGRGGVGIFGRGLASTSMGEERINRFNYFSTGQFNGMGY